MIVILFIIQWERGFWKIPSIKSVTAGFFGGGGGWVQTKSDLWLLTQHHLMAFHDSWATPSAEEGHVMWLTASRQHSKWPCAENYLPNCRFQGPEWPLNLKPDSFPQVHTWFDKCRKYSQNLFYGVKMLTTLLHQICDVVEEPLFYYHLLLPCGNKAIWVSQRASLNILNRQVTS